MKYIWGHTKKWGMTVVHLANGIGYKSLCGLADIRRRDFIKTKILPKDRIKCRKCFDGTKHKYI